jgi:hypothetical protein
VVAARGGGRGRGEAGEGREEVEGVAHTRVRMSRTTMGTGRQAGTTIWAREKKKNKKKVKDTNKHETVQYKCSYKKTTNSSKFAQIVQVVLACLRIHRVKKACSS